MALRSPMRRVGLLLLAPLFVFGLVDLVRTLSAQSPTLVAADAFEASFSREHITAHGIAHLESGIAYNISTYYQNQLFGEPIRVEPFALLPLNVPERSEGRVLLAEVPLSSDGELPADLLDRDRFEFTGLAGALPRDLEALVAKDFAPGTRFARVQVRIGAPRARVSLVLLLMPLLLLGYLHWRAAAYERSEDAARGYPQRVSKFFLVLGLVLVASVLWLRVRLDPEADSIGLVITAYGWLWLWLTFAFWMRGRRQWPEEKSEDERPDEPEALPPRAAEG